ncbi:PASTA domain-containing protein, partial [Microbacterium sp. CPCC 204701]|uniref:PASTA domain-containing protein n=1 Tax=Microbacterium sp. CPCC 204701 TaxID=2493084 RepID=UPI000FDB4B8A
DDTAATGELTAVLPSTATGPTSGLEEVDNATRLRAAVKRRRAKGGWLVAVVFLLAALAAGLGWWFGSGPGSMVAVADVSGMTFEAAAAELEQDTLIAVRQDANSLDIPVGHVISTDPSAGMRVERDSEVTVMVSLGPADATFPKLNGLTEEDVRAQLTAQHVAPGESAKYYTDGPAGTVVYVVVHPAAGGDDIECGEGCTAHQGDSASLGVSLGPLPSVVGEPVDDATRILAEAGITIAGQTEEYSADIAEGSVIRMTEREPAGWWREGDSTTLIVSLGPPPIEVPNVVGDNLADAMAELEEAGFRPTTVVPQFVWGLFTVASTDPEAGTTHRRGTEVRVTAAG